MKTIIKNGTVVDGIADEMRVCDILIEDGVIKQMAEHIEDNDAQVIDASGKYVAPGFVDMHCHLREPGFERKENIETGTAAAVKGGFTSLGVMANTSPVVDNVPLLQYIQNRAAEVGKARVYQYASVTKGMQGKELTEMCTLKDAGVIALSDDGMPVSNPLVMRRALNYAKDLNLLIISHCEDKDLADNGSMNEGLVASLQGVRSIPAAAEEVMVARDILLAESLDTRVHLAHISTERSIALIRDAKKRGAKITCETAPHYFSLTEEECANFNTYAKVNPPLRTQRDVDAIRQGLADGVIDCIATDHAPHHLEDKRCEFDIAANGFSGLETAFALAVTNLIQPKRLTLPQVVKLMSTRPAEILGVEGGKLTEGAKADVVILDLDAKWTVDPAQFASKGKNTPLAGRELTGKVDYTLVDGKIVYQG